MATKRFRVELQRVADSEVARFTVPFDAQKAFGARARVPVRGTINGFPFRSSIFPVGDGRHYMVVNKAMRAGAGVKAGDTASFTMERDDEPRAVTPPSDFARALKANKAAQAFWEKLSYWHQREYVSAIEEAKRPETRARRIEKAVAALASGKKP